MPRGVASRGSAKKIEQTNDGGQDESQMTDEDKKMLAERREVNPELYRRIWFMLSSGKRTSGLAFRTSALCQMRPLTKPQQATAIGK